MVKSKRTANGNEPANDSGASRLPPQDLEAERAVLGAMLLSGPAIDEVQAVVAPDHFYGDPNRRICEAIFSMRDRNKDVDSITLLRELEKRKDVDEVGGKAYIVQLISDVPHTAYAGHYAGYVRKAWVKRTIIDACTETLRLAYAKDSNAEDILVHHDNATQKLLETGVNASEVCTLSKALVDALVTKDEDRAHPTVNTGYAELDEMSGGLRGGNMIVVAARASMGKTAFANNLALRLIRNGHPTLFFSLEQGSLEIGERMLSIDSGVSAHSLRRGEVDDVERQLLNDTQNRINDFPLYIDDRGDRNVSQIGATVRLFRRRHKIEVVMVDYLQMIRADDDNVNREQQVARTSRALKSLARTLDIPVLVLAQLNREVEKRPDKRPKLSDLRESGSVEQDADQVWAIHRHDYYDPEDHPGEAEICVLKNRNGPTGRVRLAWQKESMRFTEPEFAPVAAGEDW